ncbi:MAG: murein biosynthesis integral rane protein MurJ [Frankiales bacterium]|nr:murein biosynthesis integral rane protein MurJ [Frankiales bacterium]
MAGASTAGPLQVGDLLAGRYLLLEVVADDGPAALWRANDEILARPVAVKVIATPNKRARDLAEPFLAAAVRTCAVNHAGLARVYDATLEQRPGRGNDVAFVIREWVDGQPLDEHLAGTGALAPLDAVDVVRQAADALVAAHAGGLLHGRLHLRNVLVTPGGRVRLTDAAVAAALHGEPVAEHPTPEGIRSDTKDLAGVLYALVTGRWPGLTGLSPGVLPLAPESDGQLLSARQVRAGVPRPLDGVITRGLNPSRTSVLPPLITPAAFADAADASVLESRVAAKAAALPPTPTWLRSYWPALAALTLVIVVGVAGWLLGLAVGDLRRPANAVDAIVSPTSGPSAGSRPGVAFDLTKVVVRDFDPAGDGQENPDQVRNSVDGFPNTTWSTSRYKTARFGGIKGGVGLLLDLGSVRTVHSVQVGFSAAGANVELRASETPPATGKTAVDSLQLVAAAVDGKQVASLQPSNAFRARYLVVWITSLPKEGDGYRVGVSELRIT